MSQVNVELARRAYGAVNRRDLGGLLELMDADVEVHSRIVAMEGGLLGHDGVRRWWENWFGAFPDYDIEVGDVRDLGEVTLARREPEGDSRSWRSRRWRLARSRYRRSPPRP